jgi:hypothetical protein
MSEEIVVSLGGYSNRIAKHFYHLQATSSGSGGHEGGDAGAGGGYHTGRYFMTSYKKSYPRLLSIDYIQPCAFSSASILGDTSASSLSKGVNWGSAPQVIDRGEPDENM